MRYLSILVDIKDRSVLVIGGGNVAVRKVRILRCAGAKVKIVAKFLCSELLALDKKKHIEWISERFDPSLLAEIFLIIVATNDERLNSLVYKSAEESRILVNVVDDPLKCSFIFPSVINRDPVIITVSSSGKSPVLSRILREKLESLLPNYLGLMASLAGYWRHIVKRYISNVIERRKFWENIFYGSFASLISRKKVKQANKILLNSLISLKNSCNKGMIALVGAGPGDSGLLTLRGLQFIQQADIVLYDYLVGKDILDMVRRDAKCICVGKRFGYCSIEQEKINDLLINFANQGKQVVRLKGGDPFIFGRGGEELCAIAKANIPFQIVPGITAASGAAAYAGIPLTDRKYSHGVIFISGYLENNSNINMLNWRMLACKNQTIVVYMGIKNAFKISELLINNGRDPDTLVAIISRATCKDQQILVMKLEQLKFLSKFTISLPALLIIGEIVSTYSNMYWFGKQILKKYKFGSIIELS